jgi:hypothetical protein
MKELFSFITISYHSLHQFSARERSEQFKPILENFHCTCTSSRFNISSQTFSCAYNTQPTLSPIYFQYLRPSPSLNSISIPLCSLLPFHNLNRSKKVEGRKKVVSSKYNEPRLECLRVNPSSFYLTLCCSLFLPPSAFVSLFMWLCCSFPATSKPSSEKERKFADRTIEKP